MEKKKKRTRTKIIEDRLYFFVELVIVFVGSFFLIYIADIIVTVFVDQSNILYAPLYFLFESIAVLIAIPLFLYLAYLIFKSQNEDGDSNVQINPTLGHLRLYKLSKNNLKYQILYGFLILFLIFIPLDFFTYLLNPGIIEYQANSLGINNAFGAYFSQSYGIFLALAIIIHISVALKEESIARGLIAKRGSEYFNSMSAVIISSLYFGLGHLFYIFFNPISWYPFIWFSQAFFIGIILSLTIIKKKWLFPLIFSHALNNIISAHVIWNFMQGNDFPVIAVYLYIPLLIISVFLLIWQFSRIKNALSIGIKEFVSYFKPDSKRNESKGDIVIRIIFDIIMGFMIFGIGLLVL